MKNWRQVSANDIRNVDSVLLVDEGSGKEHRVVLAHRTAPFLRRDQPAHLIEREELTVACAEREFGEAEAAVRRLRDAA